VSSVVDAFGGWKNVYIRTKTYKKCGRNKLLKHWLFLYTSWALVLMVIRFEPPWMPRLVVCVKRTLIVCRVWVLCETLFVLWKYACREMCQLLVIVSGFFITVMQGRRKKLESVGHQRWKISWGLTFHLPPFCRLGAVLFGVATSWHWIRSGKYFVDCKRKWSPRQVKVLWHRQSTSVLRWWSSAVNWTRDADRLSTYNN